MNDMTTIAPVTLSLDLNCTIAHAFETYTVRVADWWPLESHSVDLEKAQGVVFESTLGGRIYEIGKDGQQHLWGTVLECRAPDYLRYSWHPGREPKDGASEVEVRFTKTQSGTRMDLVHTGFEIYGERAGVIRENYVTGWQFVAGERFKTSAEA